MSWNKEKGVFAMSLLVFAVVVWNSIGTLGGGVKPSALTVDEPSSTGSVPPEQVELSWFRVADDFDLARDPFRSESSWRPTVPDPLPEPPLGSLRRRVPLPAPIARAARARPHQESVVPILKLEEQ